MTDDFHISLLTGKAERERDLLRAVGHIQPEPTEGFDGGADREIAPPTNVTEAEVEQDHGGFLAELSMALKQEQHGA
jgi:hypothetical protein